MKTFYSDFFMKDSKTHKFCVAQGFVIRSTTNEDIFYCILDEEGAAIYKLALSGSLEEIK